MIGVLDSGSGNLRSVQNTLRRLAIPFFVSDQPQQLQECEKIVFPGVGHARETMKKLKERKLDVFIRDWDRPYLGICLGMQLLMDFSEEGATDGLGIIPGKVVRFQAQNCGKVPHMGWNLVTEQRTTNNKPFIIQKPEYFYFVHSYYVPVGEWTVASCDYGGRFSAVVNKENYWGMQFHPEKSGNVGAEFLRSFLSS